MQGVDFCKGGIPGAEGALLAQERGPTPDAERLLCVGLQGHLARVKMNDRHLRMGPCTASSSRGSNPPSGHRRKHAIGFEPSRHPVQGGQVGFPGA